MLREQDTPSRALQRLTHCMPKATARAAKAATAARKKAGRTLVEPPEDHSGGRAIQEVPNAQYLDHCHLSSGMHFLPEALAERTNYISETLMTKGLRGGFRGRGERLLRGHLERGMRRVD